MPFLLVLILLFAVALLALAHVLISRARTQKQVATALDLALYTVLVPQENPDTAKEKEAKPLKEAIAVMEQLYAGMVAIKENKGFSFTRQQPTFTLELSLPSVGEEISFYIAVPRVWSRAFEKQVNALFPHARIDRAKDYNIFNSEGVSVGSQLKLKKSGFFPVRTYQHLEADPLELIANAFSKLKKEGEGAAFQIVVRPTGTHWSKRGQETARFMREGKTVEKIERERAFAHKALEATRDIVHGPKSKGEEEGASARPTVFDEQLVKIIEDKANRVGFDVNIRLLASAPTKAEATSILQELEDSFLQFAEPQANSFRAESLEGKALERLIYNFSFRMFDPGAASYVSTEELTSLYHFPIRSLSAAKVKFLKAREAPPPPNLPANGIVLGENIFRGERSMIRFQRDDRRRHLYIMGQTGTGKSNFLEDMARQDIENGEGVCFIDPHGESIEKLLTLVPKSRVDDVIYFNPGDTARPLALNMLEYDARFPEQKTFVVNELFSIFQKLYGGVPESMGPIFEQYFRNATMLAIDDPNEVATLLEVGRVMADKEYRDYKLSKCTNVVVKTFWRDVAEKAGGEASLANIVPYITSKFDVFLANEIMRPMIAQPHSSFDFRKVMDEQKILLINLSKGRLGELNSSLLGLIIVGKLLLAALSRVNVERETRNDFFLYIDEFQNVTTPSIATILSEARKYRLNLTISHQFIGQLTDDIKKAVFGNVGSMASLRIGVEDAEFMEQQFAPVFNAQDLINLDNGNAYMRLLINGQTSRPFSMHMFLSPQGDRTIADAIKEYSRLKYGRAREEVEAEITKRYEHQ